MMAVNQITKPTRSRQISKNLKLTKRQTETSFLMKIHKRKFQQLLIEGAEDFYRDQHLH